MKTAGSISFVFLTLALLCLRLSAQPDTSLRDYRQKSWYPALLQLLTAENRIDGSDAFFMKTISSNSRVAFEETVPQVIARCGKIQESDLIAVYQGNEKYQAVYVLVRYNIFYHLFAYQPQTGRLERIQNRNSIVIMREEELKLKQQDEAGILFYTEYQQDPYTWKKYFYLDKKAATLTHTKNCRMLNNREECNMIN